LESLFRGRIAGDFLSSRKAARAERCTPKTTAAGRVAEVTGGLLCVEAKYVDKNSWSLKELIS